MNRSRVWGVVGVLLLALGWTPVRAEVRIFRVGN